MSQFPVGVQDFASMFVQMQEKRHRADYDPTEFLYKSSVSADIQAAKAAIAAFKKVQGKHRRAFAAYLLIRMR
jgi:hypothetical protein